MAPGSYAPAFFFGGGAHLEHPEHISNVRGNEKLRLSKDLVLKMFKIVDPLLFILLLGG